jgi:hypothetical protein
MLKSRKTVRVLVRYGSRFYEKLVFKRQNLNRGRFRAFKQKSRKTVIKVRYATLCGRPKRSLAENGRVRYGTVWTRSADKFGLHSVDLF